MKPRIIGLIPVLALGVVFAAAAQSSVGDIVYLEDGVGINRNGEQLGADDVYIGAEVENYDLMRTDATGYAEVELTAPGGPGATVRVSPNTTFSFEINRQGPDTGSQYRSVIFYQRNLRSWAYGEPPSRCC